MEMPSVDGTTNNDLSINTQRMPDFATSVQYNWNSSSHVKLGAIVRSMTYSSNVHEKAIPPPASVCKHLQPSILRRNYRHSDSLIMEKVSDLT